MGRGAGQPEEGRKGRAARARAGGEIAVLADRLHGAAIRLLRRLRKEDEAIGLSGPQASALSVLVFGGPQTLKGLANAEQVRPATMSALITELERGGYATKTQDHNDGRVVRIAPTPLGLRLLEEGRARRLAVLMDELAGLSVRDRAALANATSILETLNRAGHAPLHPRHARAAHAAHAR